MAITIKYKDETEIQVLPAIRTKKTISIADATGEKWKTTKPDTFSKALTKANEDCNNLLVPSIKLAKSISASLPKNLQLTGYHVESLALDAAKSYKGTYTPKDLLVHIIRHSSSRVLKPIIDITGQERSVDGYLGKARSGERMAVSSALATISRRLNSVKAVGQWKAMFED